MCHEPGFFCLTCHFSTVCPSGLRFPMLILLTGSTVLPDSHREDCLRRTCFPAGGASQGASSVCVHCLAPALTRHGCCSHSPTAVRGPDGEAARYLPPSVHERGCHARHGAAVTASTSTCPCGCKTRPCSCRSTSCGCCSGSCCHSSFRHCCCFQSGLCKGCSGSSHSRSRKRECQHECSIGLRSSSSKADCCCCTSTSGCSYPR